MAGLLIDIEKYVRQLLPPNRRLPKHIAFATVLFKPLELLIDEFNAFVYDSQFDVGTPGQVAVLEFVLQNYVHPNIRILDGDGSRVDFRVLVPEGLSQQERGEVVRLVERSRMRSKRYEVSDSIDWGSGGSDPVTGLAFLPGHPFVTLVGDTYLLQWGVNKAGVYPTKIYNLTNGDVFRDMDLEYSGGAFVHSLPSNGLWVIQVASLSKTVNAAPIEYVTKKPTWLNGLALTNNADSRDATLYVNALVDVKLRVQSLDGLPLQGYTHDNAPWDSENWIEGTNEWASAEWPELFRLNPTAIGVNGLTPGKSYKFFIVRASNPSPVYTRIIPIPTTNHPYPPVVIDISDDPNLGTCKKGPSVGNVVFKTQRQWIWEMDAEDVFRIRVHAKNMGTGQIVQSKEVQVANIVNGVPVGVFSPSWRPVVNWDTPLPAGSYQLGTEGVSCSSGIDWSDTFTVIEEDTGPVDPGPDPDPQLGDYIVRYRTRCFPGDMKLQFDPLPGGGGFYVTDIIETTTGPNKEVSYVINGSDLDQYRGIGRLVNHVWHFPSELSIRKYKNKIGIPNLSVAGNGQPGNGDMDAFEAFYPHNTSCAQIDVVAVKQLS